MAVVPSRDRRRAASRRTRSSDAEWRGSSASSNAPPRSKPSRTTCAPASSAAPPHHGLLARPIHDAVVVAAGGRESRRWWRAIATPSSSVRRSPRSASSSSAARAPAADRKDRGYALRASLRALEGGASLVMTADVPPGPARRAAPASSRWRASPAVRSTPWRPPARASVFNTWSRVTLNLPFSARVRWRRTILVPRNADAETMERLRVELEHGLEAATLRAYELAGADVQRILRGPPPAGPVPPHGRGWRSQAIAAPATCCARSPACCAARAQRQGGHEPALRNGSGSRARRAPKAGSCGCTPPASARPMRSCR